MKTEIIEYNPFVAALAELSNQYEDVVFDCTTLAGMDAAKKGRAEIRGCRTRLEKERVKIKSRALERCRLIDSDAKELENHFLSLEKPIDAQIKVQEDKRDAEKRAKEEAERLAKEQAEREAREAEEARMEAQRAEIARGQAALREAQERQEAAERESRRKIEEAERAARLEREEADRKARAEQQAESDRIAKAQRELEEAQAKARREQEEKDRAAREKKEAAEREKKRKIAERADAEKLLELFIENPASKLPEYAEVKAAIGKVFAKRAVT